MGTTYLASPAILPQAGGYWSCTVHMGYCTQSSYNAPIVWTTGPSDPTNGNTPSIYIYYKEIFLPDMFKGATSIPATISYDIQVTAQGGSPSPLTLTSFVAGTSYTYPDLQYNTPSPVSMSHTDVWDGPPPNTIDISLEAITSSFNGATITLSISNLKFVINNIVYGGPSTAGSSSPSASSTPSLSPSSSNPGSSSITSINTGTSLSHSTSLTTTFTTTISGHQTVVGSILPQPSDTTSQSGSSTPSSTPGSTSATASNHIGIIAAIAGSLVGLGVILIAFAFWYRRRRRGESVDSKETTTYGDEQSGTRSDSRMVHSEPWVPRPYPRGPYSPTTENMTSVVIGDERMGPVGEEEDEDWLSSSSRSSSSSWETGDSSSTHASLPAYSQITPGRGSTSGRSTIQDE